VCVCVRRRPVAQADGARFRVRYGKDRPGAQVSKASLTLGQPATSLICYGTLPEPTHKVVSPELENTKSQASMLKHYLKVCIRTDRAHFRICNFPRRAPRQCGQRQPAPITPDRIQSATEWIQSATESGASYCLALAMRFRCTVKCHSVDECIIRYGISCTAVTAHARNAPVGAFIYYICARAKESQCFMYYA
jgi:hypothetical protein